MTEMPKRTEKEILNALEEEWDFNRLIEPYREGGTESKKVRRTWGTMIDWLVNRHSFPADVVGAGIFLVWMHIKTNGHFVGDGSYGSAGNEFAQAVRVACASIMKQKMTQTIFTGVAGKVEEHIKSTFVLELFRNLPWWVKLFSIKWWKNRKKIKALKVKK